MYLKSLKLVGFKSFADRTRLELEPGITVVVGPNGSGKSNLVDAVAWAMGTQAPSALRTQRMEDLVFAGTATRPAFGRAEVSVTFDNASGLLPLDLPEVTITRRLHRDGESEYEVNGTGCRLLDVQDLLSDSGVGRHQHVIVGQGQLDAVLNAGPEDHRAIIEEAAGVLKHRLRKERAVRRLERTDADVLRLHDILRELKRQMRPLRRQAEAAGRHEDLRAEARALRLFLIGGRLRSTAVRLEELEAEERSWSDEIEAGARELSSLEPALPGLEEEARGAAADLDRDTAAAARLETTAERLRRIAQVARERHRALTARAEGAGERRRDLEEEIERIEEELASGGDEERRLRVEAERLESALRSLEEEERSLAEQEALPPQGAAAVVRGDLRALEAAAERDAREAESVEGRLAAVRQVADDERAELERLEEDVRSIDALAGQAQEVYEGRRTDRLAAQEAWEAAEADAGEARLALAEARARVEALEQTVAGAGDPAARQAAASSPGVMGGLLDLLDPPPDLLPAVEAVLGPWSRGFLARAEAVPEVVAALKSGGLGGISLVPAREPDGEPPARAVAEAWGLEALVDRLGPGADPSMAAVLLGDVVLAEGWSAAWDVVRRHAEVRAVTPEGDVITAEGVVIGDPDGASPAVLRHARSDAGHAEVTLARAESRRKTARRAFDDARARERVGLECLELLEARLSGAAEALARLERSRSAAEAEIRRLEDRREVLSAEGSERRSRMAELRERLAGLAGEEAARQEAWEALASRRRDVAARRDAARRSREEAASALGAVVERRRMLETRRQDVLAELSPVEAPVDASAAPRLAEVEATARDALELIEGHLDRLRERQVGRREESAAAASRLAEARARSEELRGSLSEARERRSEVAVTLAELRARRESLAEALRRDADASEEEALAAAAPELPEGQDPEARLESLDAELRRMGPVNPLAAAEFRELEERASFLEGQLADLETSRSELRKVITALDEQMVELFTTAYEDVARHFEESFQALFPGGRGRLRLTDRDDPLGTGVEIQAQPLGKRVSRLGLLSGGERSLVALAFLFAVFQARPSPFYLLDEVDAALDDANLRRFLRLLGRLRQTAQLVVITHQQQTMEAADLLYGVTLEPGGSSQVVAKRLSEATVPA